VPIVACARLPLEGAREIFLRETAGSVTMASLTFHKSLHL